MTKTLPRIALAMLAMPVLTLAARGDAPPPVIDNGRVTVRDVPLSRGQAGPAIQHSGDYIILYVKGGRIRGASGKSDDHASGSAMAGHGGTTSDTALDADAHEVVVELKDAPSNTVPNTTGLPPGFPRPGAKKVFENDKVKVWNYTWLPGKPTPMHFHNTEVVVVYLGDGDVAATTPDGKKTVTHRNPGDIVFNLANRSHSEELVRGEMSGIMLELK
jgi:quercetin dioxygenase-like cupin family protein